MTIKKTQTVASIKDGTVIDHIATGNAMKIVALLKLNEHRKQVSIGLNFPSKAFGCKDLIKVEGRELTPNEANQVALLAPDATISIVKNFEVIKKFQIALPNKIEGIITCTNDQCITNHEPIETLFLLQENRRTLRCKYCSLVIPLQNTQQFYR